MKKRLESLLVRVEQHPDRYPDGYHARVMRVLELRRKRDSKLWLWRAKAAEE